jgi:hypothetical protein
MLGPPFKGGPNYRAPKRVLCPHGALPTLLQRSSSSPERRLLLPYFFGI